jgi:hypothetical protein
VKVSNPGPVAYVAAEGGAGMRSRMRAWAKEYNITTEIPFFTLPEPTEMLDSRDLDTLVAGLEDIKKRHGELRLVVLDTLARTFGGGDENSSKDMSAYVASLDRLRVKFGCAVLVVHHSGLQEKNRARGSSVLRAALDWEMYLEKREDVRVLSVTKCKDHETPLPRCFKPKSVSIGWRDEETGDELTSCVLEAVGDFCLGPGPKLKRAQRIGMETFEALAEEAKDGRVHIDVWREEAKRRGISTSTEKRARNQACKRAIDDLLELGLVEIHEDFCWLAGTGGTRENSSRLFQGEQEGTGGTHPFRGVPCVPTPKNHTAPLPLGEDEKDA